MSQAFKNWVKGILLRDNDDTGIGDLSGSLTAADNGAVYIYQQKMKAFLSGAETEILTTDQTQTVSNKTIDSAANTVTIDATEATVSNINTTHLAAGILDTDLNAVAGTDTTIPSAKATKDYVDAQVAGKDEASEITFDDTNPNVTGVTVQAATDDVANTAASAASAASAAQSTADDHIADTVDAHDGSAISYNPAGSTLTSIEMQATADEIAGRLDATESVADTAASDLSTHISDTSTHGITSTILGATETQDVSNKTFTDAVTLEEQGSTPSNPSAGDKKFYAKTDGKIYTLDSAGNEIEVGSGSGGGSINFIDNSDAEVDATGYATYADVAGVKPVDGTGGSPAGITFTRSETLPLIGGASFVLAKDAVNRQGEGASYDFSIDSIFQAKLLEIKLYKDFSDANIADGDITCFIYDVTNTTLIEPIGFELTADTREACLSFQAAPDSTSYRLIFHQSSTSATAYSAKVDNISVVPAECSSGSSVDSFRVYSGSAQNIVNSAVVNFDTVIHDSLSNFNPAQNRYEADESGYYNFTSSVLISGAPSPTNPYVSLNKNGVEFSRRYLCLLVASTDGSTGTITADVYLEKGDNVSVFLVGDVSFDIDSQQARTYFTGHKISSGSGCSTGADEISLEAFNTASDAAGTGSRIAIFDSESLNGNLLYDNTTGIITFNESGRYFVSFNMYLAAQSPAPSNLQAWISSGGKLYGNWLEISPTASTSFAAKGYGIIDAVKGQTATVLYHASGGNDVILSGSAGEHSSSVQVFKIASGGSCGSPEAAIYGYIGTDLPSSGITGTPAVVKFSALDEDSRNAYNSSTGNYTIPESGLYSVSAQVEFLATYAVGNDTSIDIRKNGSTVHLVGERAGSTQGRKSIDITGLVYCEKGDTVAIFAATGGTGPVWASSIGGSGFNINKV